MGATSIEWTRGDDGSQGSTWNPIRGTKGRHICQRISPGCKRCYAATMNVRFSGIDYVAGADTPRLDEEALTQPLRWKRGRRVFVCSMTDLFWDQVPDAWIERIFVTMLEADQHTYLVLTKRAARMRQWVTQFLAPALLPTILERIWLGVSVEDQDAANARIPLLLQTPATVRFLSVEPMLGPVDLAPWLPVDTIGGVEMETWPNWVIAGAESGHGARLMDEAWVRAIKDQCVAARVPFFYKQGAVNGRKISTPELDGQRWTQFPISHAVANP